MSFKKIQLHHEKSLIFLLIPLVFLLFFLIGCDGSRTSSASSSASPVSCTYTLTFDTSATQAQKDQAKAEFEASATSSAGSTEKGIVCHSSVSWDESNPNQLQATVTINCYDSNRSDSGATRPPAQTKPPASRLSYGTLVKVSCSDE